MRSFQYWQNLLLKLKQKFEDILHTYLWYNLLIKIHHQPALYTKIYEMGFYYIKDFQSLNMVNLVTFIKYIFRLLLSVTSNIDSTNLALYERHRQRRHNCAELYEAFTFLIDFKKKLLLRCIHHFKSD